MQKLENSTLQRFIDCVVKALKDENNYGQKAYDIPFIISSLYQSFQNETYIYQDFISDLEKWSDYYVNIEEVEDQIAQITIVLIKYRDDEAEYYDDYDSPNYDYRLTFSYDERLFGYCKCTSDMKDYREDKMCCGHGCDAVFCSFVLHKIIHIAYGQWNGDEHDYWEFEDEFYSNEKELEDKKAEEDKVRTIKELKARIEADTKKLAELVGEQNED